MGEVFGIGDKDFQLATLRHGTLCELACELADTLDRLHRRFFVPGGHRVESNAVLLMMALHHAASLSMTIPLNLRYSGNEHYQQIVWHCQSAAAFAVLATNYAQTLDTSNPWELLQMQFAMLATNYAQTRDTSNPWELLQMQVSSVAVLVITGYQRVVLCVALQHRLIQDMKANADHDLASLGLGVSVLLLGFNLVILKEGTKRCFKFCRRKAASDNDGGKRARDHSQAQQYATAAAE
ncbi:hypothetical protein T484DRAFT_1917273 [Baffinella frigidus]|nr:hypothetical protein T484DRAFT_1917273 [Cryptophyta sp. CCMP2293]